ncbi:MAG: SEL1-like repeat protein [Candidatus Methanomethylophilaceae archaeon]|nr:SEL1-like repeat protein [Candidatus Methanomethylophilaceae archaeon]
MRTGYAIELKDVTKSFKLETRQEDSGKAVLSRKKRVVVENKVLNGISLSVRKGEILGVLGRNGSGKSTLLSIMAKILEPDSGTVEIDGKVASILSLSMGFQYEMSGRENIYLKGELYGFSRKDMDEKLDAIVDFSGIGKHIDNPIKTYSTGMVSRLAFSIMLHVDAEIMLVDEVLSTGDASFSAKASSAFKKLMRNGKTVVFVSHNVSAVEEMCSRVVWIDGGKAVADGAPKVVCSKYSLAMSRSFDVVYDQAQFGVAASQYRLALMYRDGDTVEKDEDKYLEWLKAASDQGHVEAQVAYADLLFGSEDTRADAVSLYKSAADKGDVNARSKLSAIYGGDVDDPDRKELLTLCKELADSGNPPDVTRYAAVLLKTAWSENDRKAAFEQYLKASEGGNPDVYFQLATMYDGGIGTAKDFDSYVRMLKLAAESGHHRAMVVLGDMYRAGRRIERDEKEAFGWYLKGALDGDATCQYAVACMYRDGEGVEKDDAEAEKWFRIHSRAVIAFYQTAVAETAKMRPSLKCDPDALMEKAAACYYRRAVVLMAPVYKSGGSGVPDKERAKEAYAAAAAYPCQSSVALADMYYEGTLFEQDYRKAAELYLKSLFLLDGVRNYRLYLMFSKGLGVKKDEKEARKYLRMAVAKGNKDALMASGSDRRSCLHQSIRRARDVHEIGHGIRPYGLGERLDLRRAADRFSRPGADRHDASSGETGRRERA